MPSTCYNCRKAEMVNQRGPFNYDLAGLPYPVLLLNVPKHVCPNCGEEAVSFPDAEGLHRALSLAIIQEDRPLMGSELRFIRKTLDWSATKMANAIGVNPKHLSRWENGHDPVGAQSDRALRYLVAVLIPAVESWSVEDIVTLKHPKREPEPITMKATDHGWQRAA